MTEEQRAMMTRLQQIGVTLADLREYLDTHVDDDFALNRFNMAVADHQNLSEEYRLKYGPLTQNSGIPDPAGGFCWALNDFPWDY